VSRFHLVLRTRLSSRLTSSLGKTLNRDPSFIRMFKAKHCTEAWTEHVASKKKYVAKCRDYQISKLTDSPSPMRCAGKNDGGRTATNLTTLTPKASSRSSFALDFGISSSALFSPPRRSLLRSFSISSFVQVVTFYATLSTLRNGPFISSPFGRL